MLPLHKYHVLHGAKLTDFAGWRMPVQYPDLDIASSHRHTRSAASVFDVSHMKQFKISGHNAEALLNATVVSDIEKLPVGTAQLTLVTNASGGIIDDAVITKLGGETYRMVSNAINASQMREHLEARNTALGFSVEIVDEDEVILALQGPSSAEVLADCFKLPNIHDLRFMTNREFTIDGGNVAIQRCGYTGEDGFELSSSKSVGLWLIEQLLKDSRVRLAGLGARDSLRLEAGLCLYGQELSPEINPFEAKLGWLVSKVKLEAQEKNNNFKLEIYPGAAKLLKCWRHPIGEVRNVRVGFLGDKVVPRHGDRLYVKSDEEVGWVTSGGYSPTLNKPICMAYVRYSATQDEIFAKVRGKMRPLTHTAFPFVGRKQRNAGSVSDKW